MVPGPRLGETRHGDPVDAPGVNSIPWLWEIADLPDDLTGKTVLDIGTTNGASAFMAERRGAERVVAVDILDQDHFGFRSVKVDSWPTESPTRAHVVAHVTEGPPEYLGVSYEHPLRASVEDGSSTHTCAAPRKAG